MAEIKQNDEKIHLSTVEEQLIEDNDGSYRDELLSQLFAEATRLKNLKDKGAAPEDFTKIDNLLTAVVAAMEVVDKNWKQHHAKP